MVNSEDKDFVFAENLFLEFEVENKIQDIKDAAVNIEAFWTRNHVEDVSDFHLEAFLDELSVVLTHDLLFLSLDFV